MQHIKINKEFSDLLEQLLYENNALKNLIKFLILEGIPFDDESFQRIYREGIESNIQYNIAKDKLIKKYDLHNKNWHLDFDMKQIIIGDENK